MICDLNLLSLCSVHVAKWGLKSGPIERWEDVLVSYNTESNDLKDILHDFHGTTS